MKILQTPYDRAEYKIFPVLLYLHGSLIEKANRVGQWFKIKPKKGDLTHMYMHR